MSKRKNASGRIALTQEERIQSTRRNRDFALSQPNTSLNDSYSEDADRMFSQRSHRSTLDVMSSQEKNQKVSTVVKYILIVARSKEVITKTRIIKEALGGNGSHYQQLMAAVKTVLTNVFGLLLLEIETNKYIIVNELENSLEDIRLTRKQTAEQTLVFLVLSHIFMNDETTTEGLLWSFLKHLNIITDDGFVHEYFGDVKQLICQGFVNQKYLDKVIEQGDPPKIEYRWGIRADHEFSRRSVLEFVSKIYNNRPIESWNAQYRAMVLAEGNESAQDRRRQVPA